MIENRRISNRPFCGERTRKICCCWNASHRRLRGRSVGLACSCTNEVLSRAISGVSSTGLQIDHDPHHHHCRRHHRRRHAPESGPLRLEARATSYFEMFRVRSRTKGKSIQGVVPVGAISNDLRGDGNCRLDSKLAVAGRVLRSKASSCDGTAREKVRRDFSRPTADFRSVRVTPLRLQRTGTYRPAALAKQLT